MPLSSPGVFSLRLLTSILSRSSCETIWSGTEVRIGAEEKFPKSESIVPDPLLEQPITTKDKVTIHRLWISENFLINHWSVAPKWDSIEITEDYGIVLLKDRAIRLPYDEKGLVHCELCMNPKVLRTHVWDYFSHFWTTRNQEMNRKNQKKGAKKKQKMGEKNDQKKRKFRFFY